MIARGLAWYRDLSPRERWLVPVGAAVVVLGLLYLVSVPVIDALASAKARYADAVIASGETQVRVEAIKAAQGTHPLVLDAPLDTLIRSRADAAGFALTDVAPQGSDRVQIGIASARPGALLAWVADLEASGLLVERFGTTDNGDNTVAATLLLKTQGA